MSGSIAQNNLPGSSFTVTAKDGVGLVDFTGSAMGTFMSQDYDGFHTIQVPMDFTDGSATFVLLTDDKNNLFTDPNPPNDVEVNDVASLVVNKNDAAKTELFSGNSLLIKDYSVPGTPAILSTAPGSNEAVINFTSTAGTAPEAITSINFYRSNGSANNEVNANDGLTCIPVAWSDDGSTAFKSVTDAGINGGNPFYQYTATLENFKFYEASIQTVSGVGNSAMSLTQQLAPSATISAPVLTGFSANVANDGAATASSFSTDKALLRSTWTQADGASLKNPDNDATTGESFASLKITRTTNTVAVVQTVVLTNAQCAAASAGTDIDTFLPFDNTYKAQIISTSTVSPLSTNGTESNPLTLNSMQQPALADIVSTMDIMTDGGQKFTADYTITTGSATLDFAPVSGSDQSITASGSLTSSVLTYAQLDNVTVTATFVVTDTNTGSGTHTYSKTYDTVQYKTAAAPTLDSRATLTTGLAVAVAGDATTLNTTLAQVKITWADGNAARFKSSNTGVDASYAKLTGPTADIPLTNDQCDAAANAGFQFTFNDTAGTRNYSIDDTRSDSDKPTGWLAAGADLSQTVLVQSTPTVSALTSTMDSMLNGGQKFTTTVGAAGTSGTQTLIFYDDNVAIVGDVTITASGAQTSTTIGYAATVANSVMKATLTAVDCYSSGITYAYTTDPFTTVPYKKAAAPTATLQTLTNAVGDATVAVAADAAILNGTKAQMTVTYQDDDAGQFTSSADGTNNSYATLKIYDPNGALKLSQNLDNSNVTSAIAVGGFTIKTPLVADTYTAQIVDTRLDSGRPEGWSADGSSVSKVLSVQSTPSNTSILPSAIAANYDQTFTSVYTQPAVSGTVSIQIINNTGAVTLFTKAATTGTSTATTEPVSSGDAATAVIQPTLYAVDKHNGGIEYTYVGGTFTAKQIAAPIAPDATFVQNTGTGETTTESFSSTLSLVGNVNTNYNVDNMTWQISTANNALTASLLDISGVYIAKDAIGGVANTEISETQTPGIISSTFVPNTDYYIVVTQSSSFAAPTGYDASMMAEAQRTATNNIIKGAQAYMGNPQIQSIEYVTTGTPAEKAICTVVVNLNQSVLMAAPAICLTLLSISNIATDGTVAVGASIVTEIDTNAVMSTGVDGQTATFTVNIGNAAPATASTFGYATIDVQNGHTAIMGENIPTLGGAYNSASQ